MAEVVVGNVGFVDSDPDALSAVNADVYGLLWDLFNEVLLPAMDELGVVEGDGESRLNAAPMKSLKRCFSFLERVAESPEAALRDFLKGLAGDYLIFSRGVQAYSHAGPAMREVMESARSGYGLEKSIDWR
ncbi:hypothetical protein ACFH04_30755 [Streptomyces noboritoensis]|uniref:Uncharacterized protein n=1 Tax=Streptomyces noboritoensis TaxID=67337 RepID=A0ABV6TSC9_9ACTN